MANLSLVVDFYRCEPCSRKQGTEVTELVRMMPKAAIFNGQLVGTEHWCCPICFEPKFPVKKPRTQTAGAKALPTAKPTKGVRRGKQTA